MSITTQKTWLPVSLLGFAMAVLVSSCGNDTGNGSTTEKVSSKDTAALTTADTTTTATKPVAKKRKGKASAAFASDNTVKVEKGKDGVYSRADQMPEYPGGESALSNFVENHITYPQTAMDQDAEGTVTVSFVVDETGKVTHPVTTGKQAGHGLDEEAIKVVQQMPSWKPGMVHGKAVKTRLSLPVTFKLSDV